MKISIKVVFLLLFVSISQVTCAQRATYTYDNVGNRVRRQIIRIQNASPRTENPIQNEIEESVNDDMKVSFSRDGKSLLLSIMDSDFLECNFSLCNIEGKLLISGKTESISTTIDISNLSSGIYIVNVLYHNQTKSWKIIK